MNKLMEHRITPLLLEGLSDREMAFELGMSPETVKKYMRDFRDAYQARNRTHLAVILVRREHAVKH